MREKKSVTALKKMVRNPASSVTIKKMNEAISDHGSKETTQGSGKRPTYKLSDLLAQMDPNAPIPDDIKAWESMKPVGKEIL